MPDGTEGCIHGDLTAARDTSSRLQELASRKGVHVAMSHIFVEDTEDTLLQNLLLQ